MGEQKVEKINPKKFRVFTHKRLIYLSAVKPSLLVLVDGVSSTLATRQVDKRHHSVPLRIIDILQLHLEDGVRAGTISIGSCNTAGSLLKSDPDHLHDLFNILYRLLG